MRTLYEKEKQAMIDCAKQMDRYGLITLSGGNVALRVGEGRFLVTPSAMLYDDMKPEDVVVVDAAGTPVEGARRPSSDIAAALYIFERRSEVNAVLHTHQPYATAVGLVTDEMPACLTTLVDVAHGPVPVGRFTPSSDEGMGVATLEAAGASPVVILKHHGVVAMGEDLQDALECAVYLEESARAYLAARAVTPDVPVLTAEQIAAEDEDRGNYGQ